MSFDAGSVEATLTLDRTPFIASLKAAQSQVKSFASRTFEATLGADDAGLLATLANVRAQLTQFNGDKFEADLGLDSSEFQATLLGANRSLSEFAGETYSANLGADSAGFVAALTNARREGAAFAREDYQASLGARGTTETLAELKGVDTAADRLDGRDVTVGVDADENGIRSISESFKSLASNIRATGTVLSAAAIPFGIAAIGAAIPTVAALAASVSGLAVALGSGLVGASVAATGALGGLAGAFGLVAAPVALLLGNLKDYDDSLDAVKSAEDAASSAAQTRSAALKRLSEAQANVASTARDSRQAIEDQEEVLRRTRADAASSIADAERSLAETRASGARGVEDAERSLAETRASGAQGVEDAERSLAQARADASRSIADAERTLEQTRSSAAQANASAEGELESARDELASSTRSLVSAQEELNRALQDEPLNQAEATLDLADARDRVSDAELAHAEAVAEFGANSEEATDALRDYQRAQLDLQKTEADVRDTRRSGSEELQNARQAVSDLSEDQEAAADSITAAEKRVTETRAEGVRQIREQQLALRQARADAGSGIDEQRRALDRARADAAFQVAEQERALAQARAERVQGEREATREVVQVRTDAAREIADQEQALADTSREGAQRVADAQKLAADAQRAAASAAQDAAEAQKKLRQETVKLTPAQQALFDEYQAFQKLADTAFRGAQNAAASLGVSILQLAESYLPRLGKVSEATIGALSRSFGIFRAELSRPVEQAGITRYLALIPSLTGEAATAAGRLALALFNVFSRSLRFALPLTTAVGDLADEFLRWTESARGTRAIDRFFEDSVDMALRLLPAVEDLAAGFGNLVSALQRTGIVDQSARGFASLADSFERSTRAGGGLDSFLRSAKDLMPFVADAAQAVGGAILGIAEAAIGARAQGAKLTVLQQIFRGISNAAGPLQRLVVGTFRDLGPVIARLLPVLARFFSTFAGSSGPLVTFVRVLTRGLQLFNQLPPQVKQTAAQFLALKIILGGLGITGLIAPMGRFASNMLIAQGAASKLAGRSALGGVVGGIARLGVLLAGGLGLGLLAAGLFRAYQKNEDFRKSVNNLGNRAGEVFQGISSKISKQVLPALSALADKGAKAIIDIFDLGGGQREKIKQEGAGAVRQYGLGIRQGTENQTGEGTPAFELGFKIGRTIGAGLNAWAQGGKGKGGQIDKILNSTSNPVHVGEQIGQGVKQGLNNIKWGSVGARLQEQMGNAATNPTALHWITETLVPKMKKLITEGFKNFNLASIIARNFAFGKDNRDKFVAAGSAAKDGFVAGFEGKGDQGGGIGGGIVGAIIKGTEALRNWQKEGSPAKRWIPHGRNAALGYLQGFTDTMKSGQSQMQNAVQLAQGTASGRRTVAAARSVTSPGGKQITANEMRAIMREAHAAQGKNIYAAAAAAGLDPRALRLLWDLLDKTMGSDFAFRNGMGAAPN